MKNIFKNAAYFLKEVKTMIQLNLFSNILSVLSTGLIFFIFAMVISGWWMSSHVVEVIQGEAEINAYFEEALGNTKALELIEKIKHIDGVREGNLVGETEAYSRMEEILGKEAHVLQYFDENPFSPFIEIKIDLEKMDIVLEELKTMSGIEYVRDNKEVLDRIQSISKVLDLLGYIIVIGVGIATLVIISHIIRLGIYNSRDQINTLRLLGAPETFIALPFLLEGFLLTIAGGILAAALAVFALKQVYAQMAGPLPFIPLPPIDTTISSICIAVISMSAMLGIFGSLLGLSSAKNK